MKVLIAGGGTGGHIFPAISVAQAFKRMHPAIRVLFAGTSRGLEKDLVPEAGFPITLLPVGQLKGKKLGAKIRTLLRMPKLLFSSYRILYTQGPDLVLGVGGYASGPMTLVARFLNLRVGILEQNAIPGLTNRLLGKIADRVFVPFDECRSFFPEEKVVVTGNPIRRTIGDIPEFKLPKNGEKLCILVFGGSQGAIQLNKSVTKALEHLKDYKERIEFLHQTGDKQLDEVKQAYGEAGFSADTRVFFDDMADAYARSHLIIGRSGSSITEIAAAGRPSILVPYPHAAYDHQAANANLMQKADAARVITSQELTATSLASVLREYLEDQTKLETMAMNARALAKPEAADTIVDHCMKMFKGSEEPTN